MEHIYGITNTCIGSMDIYSVSGGYRYIAKAFFKNKLISLSGGHRYMDKTFSRKTDMGIRFIFLKIN